MGANDFFSKGLGINPAVGKLVVGGGLVLAVLAIASTWFKGEWFTDGRSIALGAAGLLTVSFVAGLLASVIPDRGDSKVQRKVFSWALMLLLIAYPWALFLSVVTEDFPKPFACLTQPWRSCPDVLRTMAESAAPPQPSPARPGPVNRAAYTVKLQFAGSYDRQAEIIPLASALREAGWVQPGWELGGERTQAAAGQAEVRYRGEGDRAAAEALAIEVQRKVRVAKPVRAVRAAVAPGTLEIWISR